MPSATSSSPPSPSPSTSKEAAIRAACRNGHVGALIDLATSPLGLLSDDLRCTAWPLLLGCPAHKPPLVPWQQLPPHRDEDQVDLDVHRAFVYYPPDSQNQLAARKQQLSCVILDVLRRHPTLCYFQGYHDIAQVFLLVLGPHRAPAAIARLSLLRIRDFMLTSIRPAMAQLELLRPLLRAADPLLYEHLPKNQPSFALANTITLFAHNIQDYAHITRLFDFFLANHAVMPVYLFAAVVLSRRNELMAMDKDEEDMLFFQLGKIPDPFDIEFHIARALELYQRLPPASLNSWEWWRISSSSVLKASPVTDSLRRLTSKDGEALLIQQEKDLCRQMALESGHRVLKQAVKRLAFTRMRLWHYRRYGAFGLAIFIGAYAVWIGKNKADETRYSVLASFTSLLSRFFGGP